jgi:hypothetical protein
MFHKSCRAADVSDLSGRASLARGWGGSSVYLLSSLTGFDGLCLLAAAIPIRAEPAQRSAARAVRSARQRLALGGAGVGFPEGLQIFFELRQQFAYRLEHCLHTHSFRFLQIIKYFPAPAYRGLVLLIPLANSAIVSFV